MPQLEKGGKWVFGWVIVNQDLIFQVPPVAYDEYGFMTDQELAFTKGSHRSVDLVSVNMRFWTQMNL